MSPDLRAKFRFHMPYRVISFEEVADEIMVYIKDKPERDYSIMIGSDSRSAEEAEIVTAIAVWRIHNGGRYFWTKSGLQKCATLRDRVYKEVMQSITLAQELRSLLKDRLGEEFFWNNQIAVHIDVGENGPTKEFKDSVLGMARGFGLQAFIKPESVAAFAIADRHT